MATANGGPRTYRDPWGPPRVRQPPYELESAGALEALSVVVDNPYDARNCRDTRNACKTNDLSLFRCIGTYPHGGTHAHVSACMHACTDKIRWLTSMQAGQSPKGWGVCTPCACRQTEHACHRSENHCEEEQHEVMVCFPLFYLRRACMHACSSACPNIRFDYASSSSSKAAAAAKQPQQTSSSSTTTAAAAAAGV